MRLGRPLPRAFFARPCLDVARDLVGCVLVRRLATGERLAGRLVEVEAYLGDGSDPGSHAHRGMTPRNRSMFGPPGHLYVYLSYGIHTCVNLVTEPEGRAAGILLRAAEPLVGVEAMQARRGLAAGPADRRVAGGPGRLGQAFGLSLEDDGVSALRGEWTLRAPIDAPGTRPEVTATTRIGLNAGADLPYRFVEPGSRWLSRPAAPTRRR
jgi:DNA-3-methyladenine glycosylase